MSYRAAYEPVGAAGLAAARSTSPCAASTRLPLLAGVIPTTAAAIAIATARAKSEASEGRLQDTSLEDDGAFPGLGIYDATPLGDHPETHDDLTSWCACR